MFGQEPRFEQYSMADGLSDAGNFYKESILQDREGFLWFSSFNGLNRFDGRTFKVFQFDPGDGHSLGDNLCTGMFEDGDGKIWVSSGGNGISIFNPVTERFQHLKRDGEGPNTLCSEQLNFAQKDSEGNLWMGVRLGGMCVWLKRTGQYFSLGEQVTDAISFFQQKNGTIWVGSWRGIFKKRPDELAFDFVPFPKGINEYAWTKVDDICELPGNKLLLTSGMKGFWELDATTGTFRDMRAYAKKGEAPYSLLKDRAGTVWMGFSGEMRRFDPGSKTVAVYRSDPDDPAGLPPYLPTFGFEDKAGSLWFNNRNNGIFVAHTIDSPFKTIANLFANMILPIGGDKFALNTSDGVRVLDGRTGAIGKGELPPVIWKMQAHNMAFSKEAGLWAMDENTSQVKSFDPTTGKVMTIPGRMSDLNIDGQGRMWNHLRYFDREHLRWVDMMPELQAAFPDFIDHPGRSEDMYANEKNSIWIATDMGLFHYDFKTKKGRRYSHDPQDASSIGSDVIHFLYAGSGGRFYCWTTNGLSIYDPEADSFKNYHEGNGLLHNIIQTLIEDNSGNLWIGTKKGLQMLDMKTGRFTDYTAIDGLPYNFINYQWSAKDSAGNIYLYVWDKLVKFHPDSIPKRMDAEPVYLLDFFLNHSLTKVGGKDSVLKKQVRFTEQIHLNYDQSDFGFSFAMPVFYKSRQIEYFYRLEPYQTEWQSNGTGNEAHYTNISPGQYTFRVKARTAAGVWSTRDASVQVAISPPWWRTWWAYLLYGATGILLLAWMRDYELRRKMARAEALRLQELDSLKSRLYTNITHEFRTPLTVIMGAADNLTHDVNVRNLIRRNSKNLLRLINQLLDLSKLDSGSMKMDMVQGDIIHYLRYLTESFYSMAHEKGISLRFYTEVEELVMDFDEVKVQHIIYNLLSNALKFTQSGGSVVFHTSKKARERHRWLQLRVQDTGAGIAPAQLPHIFERFFQADSSTTRKGEGTGIGLALTKELVEMMGGTIEVKSRPGEGTEFTVLLPAHRSETTAKLETDFTSSSVLAPELMPDPLSPEARNEQKETAPPTERPLLLLIEDNKDVAAYIKTLLRKDYQISIAHDGQQGIDLALETVPDIIISDVMMPKKDGFEVCGTLKQDIRTSHIPIILLTAKAEQKDKVAGLKHGADAYLMKPFDKAELFVRLEKLLELRRKLQQRYSGGATATGSPLTPAVPTLEDVFLEQLTAATEEIMGDPENAIARLERAMQLSQMQLYRKLKALTGQTPSLFIRSVRLRKAMHLLKTTHLNVSEIAYEVGFSDPAYFSRAFKEEFGMPPSSLRN